jgi:hypothetical protein
MMSTCCSKHVEAWNKYIKKEWVKLVINQNYVKMHGQQNIKIIMVTCYTKLIVKILHLSGRGREMDSNESWPGAQGLPEKVRLRFCVAMRQTWFPNRDSPM